MYDKNGIRPTDVEVKARYDEFYKDKKEPHQSFKNYLKAVRRIEEIQLQQ